MNLGGEVVKQTNFSNFLPEQKSTGIENTNKCHQTWCFLKISVQLKVPLLKNVWWIICYEFHTPKKHHRKKNKFSSLYGEHMSSVKMESWFKPTSQTYVDPQNLDNER